MTPLDYDFLRQTLKQHSGLALSADKHYFLESRLLPLARQAGPGGVGDLVLALKTGRDPALMTAVVEATTTSESFFFRDKTPFDHFRRLVMPALLAAPIACDPHLVCGGCKRSRTLFNRHLP